MIASSVFHRYSGDEEFPRDQPESALGVQQRIDLRCVNVAAGFGHVDIGDAASGAFDDALHVVQELRVGQDRALPFFVQVEERGASALSAEPSPRRLRDARRRSHG